jgi:SAM-dependent methyltransferase
MPKKLLGGSFMEELYKDVHHYKDGDYEPPKELFKFLGNIIENGFSPKDNMSVLDVGCAKGEFLYYLKKRFSGYNVEYTGVDFSHTLISLASEFSGLAGVNFHLGAAEKFKLDHKYDIITATGLISCFDNYSVLLDNLFRHLKDTGILIITNGFSTSEYDIISKYRRYDERDNWRYGWNQHSIVGITKYVEQKGRALIPHKFELPFKLEKRDDVIRSWTIDTNEGQKFTNGLNIIWNLWSLEIK